MKEFGVKPRGWKVAELQELGMFVWMEYILDTHTDSTEYRPVELPAISLANVQYYRFLSTSSEPLGVSAALETLRQKGCTLVAEDWAANHWGMILWKLASLVCSCPSLFEEKWSFDEVIRQLLYRCRTCSPWDTSRGAIFIADMSGRLTKQNVRHSG
jgi:hypothetical protein